MDNEISKFQRLFANNYVRRNVPSHPVIELLEDATIRPITKTTRNEFGALLQDSCVFYSDKSVCKLSLHAAANLTHDNRPGEYPNKLNLPHIDGTHLYAGVLIGHFGHFIIESLSRLWAVQELRRPPESIVFIKGWGLQATHTPTPLLPGFAEELFRLLEINVPTKVLHNPLRLGRLIVPSQIFGFHRARGHPLFHQFVHRLKSIGASNLLASDKVYVSRRKISRERAGGILCEHVLEENLSNYGYSVIFPEEMSICDQLQIYNGAKQIIFAEGSALHLFGLVGSPVHNVAIINRRPTGLNFAIEQLRSFGSSRVNALSIVDGYVFRTSSEKTIEQQMTAFCKMDFSRLGDALESLGFIPNQRRWRSPTPEEFEEHAKFVASSSGLSHG